MNCPRIGCSRQVDFDTFACGQHWRLLPRPMKDRVWARWHETLTISYDELVDEANAAWDGVGAP